MNLKGYHISNKMAAWKTYAPVALAVFTRVSLSLAVLVLLRDSGRRE